MKQTRKSYLAVILLFIASPDLEPKTIEDWNAYVQLTEDRISRELNGTQGFLLRDFQKASDASRKRDRLKKGEVLIEKMQTKDSREKKLEVDDGMIHHWYGAIYIPDMTLERLLAWVKDYDQHHRYFKEVEKSRLVSRNGDTFNIFLRLVRKKIITVHYNTEHTVTFREHGARRVSSRSISTRIAEIEDPGTAGEKDMPVGKDNGYFWRTNSYWRYQEEDGGVLVECESVSLSRSIPWGLRLVPFLKGVVESVPHESLESMLASIRSGASRQK
jgi:hypothetical protein